MKTRDVVISGGGIAGLVLGCLLGPTGLNITIVDPATYPALKDVKASGRTSALMEDSLTILSAAGIWQKLEPLCTDLRNLTIIDQSYRSDFSAPELNRTRFGSNIVNGQLLACAAERLKDYKNVELVQSSVSSFNTTPASVHIKLENGADLTARLLIGADGRNSLVRRNSGIPCFEQDYGQMAITALLNHTRPHNFTSVEFHRSGGPFTLVPMPGNTCSLVWVEHSAEAERILYLSKHDLEQVLTDHSQGIFGKLTLQTSPEAWPLKVMQARRLTAPRVALMAEAAHVISPIGAQGLNLSLRDIRSLTDQISTAMKLGLDIGIKAVLDKYEQDRLPDIALRVKGTHSLNQMVATDNPLVTSIRRLGFRVISSVKPLRHMVMKKGLAPDQETESGLTTRAKVTTSTR